MAGFRDERFDINGVDTLVQTAGEGEPLVYLHGGGSVTGFEALLPLAAHARLIVPHHPGYGGSADDPRIDGVEDYLHHYLDLFDLLGIGQLALIGHSLGGWMAARFAIDHARRVRRLVLAAPFGLKVPEHPTVDLFSIRDEELLGYLAVRPAIFAGKVPQPPTPEFLAARYREATATARVIWERPYDRKLARWLHRVTVPTMLLWGGADRLIPAGQAQTWAGLIPGSTTRLIPGAGHLLFDESAEALEVAADFVRRPVPLPQSAGT
jgi:pimeloyl-ACP methyl ester carboxylesterase